MLLKTYCINELLRSWIELSVPQLVSRPLLTQLKVGLLAMEKFVSNGLYPQLVLKSVAEQKFSMFLHNNRRSPACLPDELVRSVLFSS